MSSFDQKKAICTILQDNDRHHNKTEILNFELWISDFRSQHKLQVTIGIAQTEVKDSFLVHNLEGKVNKASRKKPVSHRRLFLQIDTSEKL